MSRPCPLVLLCVWLAGAGAALAAGYTIQLPPTGLPTPSGLKMTMNTVGTDGWGYGQMRFRVDCTAAAADRTLTLEVSPWGWGNRKVTTSRNVDIPAGATLVEFDVLAYHIDHVANVQLKVWLDGVYEQQLSSQGMVYVSSGGPSYSAVPATLVVADEDQAGAEANPLASTPQVAGRLEVRAPQDLARSWLAYTSYDVVFLHHYTLGRLAQREPAALAAILDWTRAGGNLVVHGLGAELAPLAEVERVLGLPGGPGAAESRGWAPALETKPGALATGAGGSGLADAVSQLVQIAQQFQNMGLGPAQDEAAYRKLLSEWRGKRREFGFGRLAVIAAESPLSGGLQDWPQWLVTLEPQRLYWQQRHGLTTSDENPDFFNWLVPGVGAAPVGVFRVLITLFVLAIGPLNYWFLWRRRQAHWLLVTVPVSALVVTALLVCYAVAADGLSTRVRIRSLTLLDQPARRAVSWSRLSYFSGMAPASLSFPDNTMVFPYEAVTERWGDPNASSRRLHWTTTTQEFSGGWLPSRTPTQLLAGRVTSSRHALSVQDAGGGLRATNQLGATIHHLVVATAPGRLWYAARLAPGQTTALSPLGPTSGPLDKRLESMAALLPTKPLDDGLQLSQGWSNNFGLVPRRRYYYGPWGAQYGFSLDGAEGQATGPLESGLRQVDGLLRGNSPWPARSYVAITDRLEEISPGTDSAREEASLHVVWGKY